MKKSKKILLLLSSFLIILVGIVMVKEIIPVQSLQKENESNIQAYNHNPTNILDNVFEKDGLTILPFIFSNSEEGISKEYVVEQFNKAGISIQEITTKAIVTGTQIKTNSKTYTVLIYGDVNADGYIDVFDAQDILMSYVFEGEYTLQGIYKLAANVDNDNNEVDVFDAQRILIFYVELTDKLVTNEPVSIKEQDTQAPVITVIGDNPQRIKYGIAYTELGATATDNVDKDVKVVIDSSKVNTNKVGTYTVTYTATDASGNTATKTRTIIVEDYVTDIKLVTKPKKLVYTQGEQLDLTGATIKEVVASGTAMTPISVTSAMVSGYDKDVIGTQTITVTYKEKKVTFEVTVNKKPDDYETAIKVTSPTKKEYKYGETIDLAGATYEKIMNSGAGTKPLAITKDMISGYSATRLGTQTITVSFVNSKGSTLTDTFEVVVKDYATDFEIIGFKENYKYNTELDLSKTTVKKIMAGPTVAQEEPMTLAMITGYNKTTLGNQELTITYADMTKQKNVTVENYTTGIEIVTNPTKLDYVDGDAIDTTGMVVKVVKADNSKETITTGWILDNTIATIGTNTINVKYTTADTIDDNETIFEASFNITILEKLSSIISTIENGNRYAKVDMILATIAQGDNQRPLTLSEVNYYIQSENGAQTTDLQVRTERKQDMIPGTSEEHKNDLVIVAKTNIIGKYTITPYVGDYATTIIKGTPIVIEVENDPEVATIELETITEGELRADTGSIDKAITFKNKYGDTVEANASKIQVMCEGNMAIEFLDKNQDVIISSEDKIVKYLRISTTLETNTTSDIELLADEGKLKVTIPIKEIAKINKIQTQDTIELYANMPANANKLIKEEEGSIYTLIPIEFINNYLETVPMTAGKFIGAGIAADEQFGCVDSIYNPEIDFFPNIDAKVYHDDTTKGNIVEATGDEIVQYIGICAADVDTIFDLKGENIIITYGETNPVTKTIKIEVTHKELATIHITKETGSRYAKTDMVLATLKEGVNETPITKTDIKYHVETQGAVTQSDIQVRTELKQDMIPGTAEEQKNDLVMVAKASKAGKYTITPYVGADYATAVKGVALLVEVENDPEVSTIEVENMTQGELRADTGRIEKEISFQNKYGDTIQVEASRLQITQITGITITMLDENKDTLDSTSSKYVKYLGIATTIENNTTKATNITVDTATKEMSIKISDIARINEIQTDKTITLYTSMPANASKFVKEADGSIYTLMPITFINNYLEKVIVEADKFVVGIPEDNQVGCVDSVYQPDIDFFPNIDIKVYRDGDSGNIVEANGNEAVQYIGICVADVDNINDLIGQHISIIYGKTNPITVDISISNI